MGLGGNAQEWEERSFDLTNNSGDAGRGVRGGAFFTNLAGVQQLSYSSRIDFFGDGHPPDTDFNFGFRVVSLSTSSPAAVPEPSMIVIGTLFGIGGLVAKRRMKK
jgi:hypothetical protein